MKLKLQLGRISFVNVIITVNLTFLGLCIYVKIYPVDMKLRKSQERVNQEMDWMNRGKANQDSQELVELVR